MQVFKNIEGCDSEHFIFEFTPKDMENEIKELMGKYKERTYYSEYLPNMIDETVNIKTYKGIFAEYIHEEKLQESSFQNLVRRLKK